MAYKAGNITVITDEGTVPYARLTGVPASNGLQAGAYDKAADTTTYSGSGNITGNAVGAGLIFTADTVSNRYTRTLSNCNCNCACRC